MFSFNTPFGACPVCEGFGNVIGIDEKLVIPNPSLSVYEGCVQCWHGEKWQNGKMNFVILLQKTTSLFLNHTIICHKITKIGYGMAYRHKKIKIQKKKSVLILSSNGKGESV